MKFSSSKTYPYKKEKEKIKTNVHAKMAQHVPEKVAAVRERFFL